MLLLGYKTVITTAIAPIVVKNIFKKIHFQCFHYNNYFLPIHNLYHLYAIIYKNLIFVFFYYSFIS